MPGLAARDEEIQRLRIRSTIKNQCHGATVIDGMDMNTIGKISVLKSYSVKNQAVSQWCSTLRKVMAVKLDMSVSGLRSTGQH
jgi:hypothetical protein